MTNRCSFLRISLGFRCPSIKEAPLPPSVFSKGWKNAWVMKDFLIEDAFLELFAHRGVLHDHEQSFFALGLVFDSSNHSSNQSSNHSSNHSSNGLTMGVFSCNALPRWRAYRRAIAGRSRWPRSQCRWPVASFRRHVAPPMRCRSIPMAYRWPIAPFRWPIAPYHWRVAPGSIHRVSSMGEESGFFDFFDQGPPRGIGYHL